MSQTVSKWHKVILFSSKICDYGPKVDCIGWILLSELCNDRLNEIYFWLVRLFGIFNVLFHTLVSR